jgi:hypothetical protein
LSRYSKKEKEKKGSRHLPSKSMQSSIGFVAAVVVVAVVVVDAACVGGDGSSSSGGIGYEMKKKRTNLFEKVIATSNYT